MSNTVERLKRREFLKGSTWATALALGAPGGHNLRVEAQSSASAPATQPGRTEDRGSKQVPPIQVGILLGTFAGRTLEARLDAAKNHGLDCVQISLDCAGLSDMPDAIPGEVAGRIHHDATTRGITLAALQGTFNMSHPDAEHRRSGLRRLRVLAEACRELGTSRIHLCSGTRDRDNMWRRHPDNDLPDSWKDMVASMREAADIGRQARVVLAFEPEVNNVVDSAQKARRLLDEIGSPFLKVTIDPANLFHAGELSRMDEILDQAFALVGKDIVLAHAKDLDHDGDAGHLPAGQGKLNYDAYVSLLRRYRFQGPLLLHGLSEAQVPECVAFLRRKLALLPPASRESGMAPS